MGSGKLKTLDLQNYWFGNFGANKKEFFQVKFSQNCTAVAHCDLTQSPSLLSLPLTVFTCIHPGCGGGRAHYAGRAGRAPERGRWAPGGAETSSTVATRSPRGACDQSLKLLDTHKQIQEQVQ